MIIGIMTNYPKIGMFLIWCLALALAYLEQTDWQMSGPVHKLSVVLVWVSVFVFLPFLIKLTNITADYVIPTSIGCGIVLLAALFTHFRKPRQLHPGTKMVYNMLIPVLFVLLFLI